MNIEHAYILYIDHPRSISYMQQSIQSCQKYDIPYSVVKWYMPPISTEYLRNTHKLNLNPNLDHPVNLVHLKEALCSTGHLMLWNWISSRYEGAVAIFEHDAVVKRNFLDIDVEDNEIVFLGYRVDDQDDYQCLDDQYTKLPISEFSGTHAYAITPNTAKYLVNKIVDKQKFSRLCENCQCDPQHLPICSVDWWLGHNMLGLEKMTIADPCPVVAVVGGRQSYTQNNQTVAKFNVPSDNGWDQQKFISGIVNKQKYFIDNRNFLTFR